MSVSMRSLRGLQAALALCLMAMTGESSAQTYDPSAELAVRRAIPSPARCGTTTEPLFYCRSDTFPGASAALELLATKDGFAASLTYNPGDSKSAELLAAVRAFFGSVGIDLKSLDRCMWRAQATVMDAGNMKLRCHYSDFSGRESYEIFADRAPQAPLRTSDVAAMHRSAE